MNKSEVEQIEQRTAEARRRRLAVGLYVSSAAFDRLSPEQKYRYLERVGMCCGAGPVTVEAHVCGMMDVGGVK